MTFESHFYKVDHWFGYKWYQSQTSSGVSVRMFSLVWGENRAMCQRECWPGREVDYEISDWREERVPMRTLGPERSEL